MARMINISRIYGVIAAGQSLSAEIDFGTDVLVGIAMPAAWTAAALTFLVSTNGVTWNDMTTSGGAELQIAAAAGQYIAIDPTLWRGVNAIMVRSGTLAAPVNQAALATLTFVCKTPPL